MDEIDTKTNGYVSIEVLNSNEIQEWNVNEIEAGNEEIILEIDKVNDNNNEQNIIARRSYSISEFVNLTNVLKKRSASDPLFKVENLHENDLQINVSVDPPSPYPIYTRKSFLKTVFEDQDDRTTYCRICLENHSPMICSSVLGCESSHYFCNPCLKSWCAAQINDGIVSIKCPTFGCDAIFLNQQIQSLVDSETFIKYNLFTIMKKNPSFRSCPKCEVGTISGTDEKPNIICDKCNYQYCYIHNNSHPNLTCAEYYKSLSSQIKRELKASIKLVQNTTKKCPWCQSPTEKISGCNHM